MTSIFASDMGKSIMGVITIKPALVRLTPF